MDIYRSTAEFRRLKLTLGLSMMLIATVLYAVMVALPLLASKLLSFVMLPVWALLSYVLCRKLYRSVGWRIDAGHIAIITGAITEGYIPADPVSLASDMVNQRFRSEKTYSAVKHLLHRAVIELNTVFAKASSLVGDVPGMKLMNETGRLFLRLQLTFLTRCSLGYTFFRGDEGLYAGAAEGCAVYALNWKRLANKNGDLVTVVIVIVTVILTLIFSFLFWFLLGFLNVTPTEEAIAAAAAAGTTVTPGIDVRYYGIFLAAMLALTLKNAYLDSWFTVYYADLYMRLAEHSAPNDGFYVRLSGESRAFAQLLHRAGGKLPSPKQAHPTAGGAREDVVLPRMNLRRQDAEHPVLCPYCKNANVRGARFCTSCGEKLS